MWMVRNFKKYIFTKLILRTKAVIYLGGYGGMLPLKKIVQFAAYLSVFMLWASKAVIYLGGYDGMLTPEKKENF